MPSSQSAITESVLTCLSSMHLWYARAPSTTGGVVQESDLSSCHNLGPHLAPLSFLPSNSSTQQFELPQFSQRSLPRPYWKSLFFVFCIDADLCRVIGLLLAQVAIYEKWKTRETEAGMQLKQSILDGPEW